MTGVDVSAEGIAQARARHPHLKLRTGSAYDDLAGQYGTFPVVISLGGSPNIFMIPEAMHAR